MTAIINVVFATITVVGIVGMLAWSIRADKGDRLA